MTSAQPIPGYPDYSATEDGHIIRTNSGHHLPTRKNSSGYLVVDVRPSNASRPRPAYVHRLVALAFLGAPPSPKHEVGHLDHNKLNNRPANLRYQTRSENMRTHSINIREKGRRFEREVASYMADKLGLLVWRTSLTQRPGNPHEGNCDLAGLPGLAPECKRTERLNIRAAYRQAARNAGPGYIPVVISRQSRTTTGQATATLSLDDFLRLYKAWLHHEGYKCFDSSTTPTAPPPPPPPPPPPIQPMSA